ncbi:cytochrome c [Acetobacter senegalensis]|uniref:cytochrome c n=1 Tax=Acetobacter senegalensis TaxID=446692 RepID=UPI002654432B|nr:cytochrome c [Acetobacter senegalensis]MDN7353329.1 cytochrome c [Acetobacter senegalensis]
MMFRLKDWMTGVASVLGCVFYCAAFAQGNASDAHSAGAERIKQGEYLFRAADCAACHAEPGGTKLTGGRAFTLPFGSIFAVNITPDKKTGIGDYTDEEWLKMLRSGVGRGGKHLYPVMPYTAYTLMSDEDALAIKAYLFSLRPEHAVPPRNQLSFPFNQRWSMIFWNWLNNPDKRFKPVSGKSAEWNRGAYLTEALGHCSQCHTPRTLTYGLSSKAYAGTVQMGWRAYNLTSDPDHGLGGWTDEQLKSYLATGKASGKGPASGPMAEAVEHGLRYMTPEDIAAIVVYLRNLAPIAEGPAVQSSLKVQDKTRTETESRGQMLFVQACAGCHLPDGRGRQSEWAALAGAHSLSDPEALNLIQVLREGTSLETVQGRVFMPGFTKTYTAEELAAIATYVTAHFGGSNVAVKSSVFKN